MQELPQKYPVLFLTAFITAFTVLAALWASPVSAQPPPCADLVITDVDIDPFQPVQGQDATVEITVKNQGTCQSLGFVVQWKSDQFAPTGPSESIPNGLAANQSTTLNLPYNFPNAGNLTTVVNVDTQNDVLETNESNNLEQFPVTVVPYLPDLAIDNFTVVPAAPVQGQNTTINIMIRNQGNAPAGPFVVQWKFDRFAPTGPSQEVNGLGVGSTVLVQFDYIFPDQGDLQTQVNIDTDNTVAESDEQNNLQIYAVQVGEAKPDLAITGFDIRPEFDLPPDLGFPVQPVAGENAVIEVKITNEGNAPALSFVVQWRSDEFAPLGASSATVPGLGIGETATVELVAVFRRAGNFETVVEIDTDRTVNESNEINNLQITPATVQAAVKDVAVIDFAVEPANPAEASLPKLDEDGNPLPLNPVVNRLTNAEVVVRNLGNVPVDSFFVEWKPRLIEAGLNQQIVGGLVPGETQTLNWEYIYRNTGTFTTQATADSSNTVLPEADNDNNVATLNITVEPELPDLEITEYFVNPPSPVAGTENDLISTFTVVVRNRGNSPAGPFDVQVRPAPLAEVLTQQVVAGLGVHESTTLQFTNVYRFPGTFNAVATVDPPIQRVQELDEDNNTAELEVVVQSPTDDLDVIDILLLPNPFNEVTCPAVPGGRDGGEVAAAKLGKATVFQNEPIKVCIYIQNLGNSPMRQFMVEFNPAEGVFPPLNSQGPATLKTQIDELGAGQVALIENDYVYERAGEFRTLTFADADKVIFETNEENNREIYYVDVIGTGPDLTITDLIVTDFFDDGEFFDGLTPQGDAYQIDHHQDGHEGGPPNNGGGDIEECNPRRQTDDVQASVAGAEPILQQGEQILACIVVLNEGDRPSGPFVVEWNPDTFGLLSQSPQTLATQVENLEPGEARLLIFPYTYTEAGEFRTLAKADAFNNVVELQEGDNEKVLNVKVDATGPDLIISNLQVQAEPQIGVSAALEEPILTQGQRVEVTIDVRNVGNRPSGPFVVEWNPDAFGLITPSPGTLSEQIEELFPFQTKTVTFNFEYNEHGEFRTIAKADAFNNVDELNEDNNLSIVNVVVDPAPLDLTVELLDIISLPEGDGSSTIVRGSPVKAEIRVSNNGNFPTGGFSVQWKPQGEFSAGGPFVRVDGLQPFESRVIETPQSSFFIAGPFDSFAEIDVFDEIIETNENNNTDTLAVDVEPRETDLTVSFNNGNGLKVIEAGEDGLDDNAEWVAFVAVLDPDATCTIGNETIEGIWCDDTEDGAVEDGDTIGVGSHTVTLVEGFPLVVASFGFEVDDFLGIPTDGRFTGFAIEFWTNADYRGVGTTSVPAEEGDGCSGGRCFDLQYNVTVDREPPELAEGSPTASPQQVVLPFALKKFIAESALPAGVVFATDDNVDETPDDTNPDEANEMELFLPSIRN